jgi:hypothetical protein
MDTRDRQETGPTVSRRETAQQDSSAPWSPEKVQTLTLGCTTKMVDGAFRRIHTYQSRWCMS